MSSSQSSNPHLTIIGADTFYGQTIIREWAKVNSAQTRQINAVANTQNRAAQQALKSVGVSRVIPCDYQNESKLSQEIKDCNYVVICPPVGSEYTKQQATTTVQALKQARVQNVIVLSLVGADAPKATEPFKNCHHLESLVKQHCDNHVILRIDLPAQYFDFCVPVIQMTDNLTLNAGNGRVAPIDLADVAKVLSHITKNKSLEGKLNGQVYQLTGPTAVDGNAIAQSMRKACNGQRPREYKNVSRQEIERELVKIYQNADNQAQQLRGQQGMETRQAQQQQGKTQGNYTIPQPILEKPSLDSHKQTIRMFMDSCDLVQQNCLTTVTKDVQQIAQTPATRLEDYFKRESQVYGRLM